MVEDFYDNGPMGIKPRKMVKLLRKSYEVRKLRIMFVSEIRMTVTSVILT